MKILLTILPIVLLLLSCSSPKKVLINEGKEYWGKHFVGDTSILRLEYKVYYQGSDTTINYTNYYPNGSLKSKVTMKNDLLMEIELVLDTLGEPQNFGQFKNGNGYVIEYNSTTGSPANKGLYVNGNKEGWWKIYHFTGTILDSTFYKEGYPQLPQSEGKLDELLDLLGPLKNNLYQ
jgi:hypothetical protein